MLNLLFLKNTLCINNQLPSSMLPFNQEQFSILLSKYIFRFIYSKQIKTKNEEVEENKMKTKANSYTFS